MSKKHDLILRVSKRSNESFQFRFTFETNFSHGYSVILPANGIIPETNTEEWNDLKTKIQTTLSNIFSTVGSSLDENTGGGFNYKVIFSDTFVSEGVTFPEESDTEFLKNLTYPMNETDCRLVFDCIPCKY